MGTRRSRPARLSISAAVAQDLPAQPEAVILPSAVDSDRIGAGFSRPYGPGTAWRGRARRAGGCRARRQHSCLHHIGARRLDRHGPTATRAALPARSNFTIFSGTPLWYGCPGVSAVTLSGRRLATPALGAHQADHGRPGHRRHRDGDTADHRPGELGTVCFLPGQAPAPGRPFKLPTAAGLRVYPPSPREIASKVIPFPFGACYRTGPVWLHVTPVQK